MENVIVWWRLAARSAAQGRSGGSGGAVSPPEKFWNFMYFRAILRYYLYYFTIKSNTGDTLIIKNKSTRKADQSHVFKLRLRNFQNKTLWCILTSFKSSERPREYYAFTLTVLLQLDIELYLFHQSQVTIASYNEIEIMHKKQATSNIASLLKTHRFETYASLVLRSMNEEMKLGCVSVK